MSKLSRYTAKVFGTTAGTAQMSEFGSLAAGTPLTYSGSTITPAIVQALSQYSSGWYSAVQGQNSPTIQDMNALCYLLSYQPAYLLEMGIGEWDSATTYYTGSLVNASGVIYSSLTDSNLNHAVTDTTNWSPISGTSQRNILINSAFDNWQRGTSVTVANTASTYLADRWYVNNALGTAGVITYSQVSGTLAKSLFGASVKVSTAPSSGVNSGINFVQVLDNLTTQQIYNSPASFQVAIKGLNNVTQVTLSLVYATTEVKPTLTNVISSQAVTVNSSGFTICQLPNISTGTFATSSGVLAVVISVTGVSSGHVSDLNNGFVAEQAILNPGTACSYFQRAGNTSQQELAMCQRFYYRANGNNSSNLFGSGYFDGTTSFFAFVNYPAPMRVAPTISTSTGDATAFNVSRPGTSTAVGSGAITQVTFLSGAQLKYSINASSTIGFGSMWDVVSGDYMEISAEI